MENLIELDNRPSHSYLWINELGHVVSVEKELDSVHPTVAAGARKLNALTFVTDLHSIMTCVSNLSRDPDNMIYIYLQKHSTKSSITGKILWEFMLACYNKKEKTVQDIVISKSIKMKVTNNALFIETPQPEPV